MGCSWRTCGWATCGLITGFGCGSIFIIIATLELLALLFTTWIQDWYNATSIYDINETHLTICAYIEVGIFYLLGIFCAIYVTCAIWLGIQDD